jgi:hypothetical protein
MRGFLVCLVVLATLCASADATGRLFEKPIAFPDQLVGRPRRVSIESLMVVLVLQLLACAACHAGVLGAFMQRK